MEIWKQSKPVKNINKKIGMAKTVKNEKKKKMLLTANINQLVISKQLDKKSLTAWIIESPPYENRRINYTLFS
ncbi:hypothetical protein [Peribacillus simplex]|uniref:hypothetical protein n=1 Tax=Peribacillus simplex TaxID=1478 RepID=UPI0016258D2C|nr:hypothetical protein [Peribacillus simplex]